MSHKKRKKKELRIPRFEQGEIDSLIMREFPEKFQEVKNKFSALKEYGLDLERTMAAILKLAAGDFEKIKGLIKGANTDPRDIISYAEYPSAGKYSWSEMSEMTEEEKEGIRKNDWEEYKDWQNREK
jgi:hypothetical protein